MKKDNLLNDISNLLSFKGIGKTINEYKERIDKIVDVN